MFKRREWIFDVRAAHFFRVVIQNLTDFVVDAIFDQELVRHDVNQRLHHSGRIFRVDQLLVLEPLGDTVRDVLDLVLV